MSQCDFWALRSTFNTNQPTSKGCYSKHLATLVAVTEGCKRWGQRFFLHCWVLVVVHPEICTFGWITHNVILLISKNRLFWGSRENREVGKVFFWNVSYWTKLLYLVPMDFLFWINPEKDKINRYYLSCMTEK